MSADRLREALVDNDVLEQLVMGAWIAGERPQIDYMKLADGIVSVAEECAGRHKAGATAVNSPAKGGGSQEPAIVAPAALAESDAPAPRNLADEETVEDGFGSVWPLKCWCGKGINQVMRPGKIQ